MKQEPTGAARSAAGGIPAIHGREDVNMATYTTAHRRACAEAIAALGAKISTTCTHYGIWSGSTFLVGEKISPGVTVNSEGSLPITVVPKRRFVG